jgi:hypothetical protein
MLYMLLGGLPVAAQVQILTANGGNDRANANLQESILSPATVNAASFGLVATFPVDGQVYAQPLYAGGLSIPGMGTHNVLYVATMENTLFAFDADSAPGATVLWQASLGQPVPSTMLYGQYGDIGGDIGILGTPAIDLRRGVIYVVSDNLMGDTQQFYLHALDLLSGAETLGGPVAIDGAGFDPMQHIQRPGLLLANGAVYVSFGSHGDMPPYHGWMMSYDASDLTHQLGVYVTTPNGQGGSIWQSGRGPAVDDSGNVYVITGNGDYDGMTNFGQSFLKLTGAVPQRAGSFTPDNWRSMSDNDADLAAGPALIAGSHRMVGADKAGNMYLVDGDTIQRGAQVIPASSGPIFNLAVWSRPGSAYVYVQGSGDMLRCYRITAAGLERTALSTAPTPMRYSRTGMMLSANGAQEGTGIVWEITGNPHDFTSPGTLRAYDAGDLSNEIWNSDMTDSDALGGITKFVNPTVANGRVFAPVFGNAVMVYGVRQ